MNSIVLAFDIGETVFPIRSSYDRCPHCGNGYLPDSEKWSVRAAHKVTGREYNDIVGLLYQLEGEFQRSRPGELFRKVVDAQAECDRRNKQRISEL